mgnify:CR=1 FL=1
MVLRANFLKISVLRPSAMQASYLNDLQTLVFDVILLFAALPHYSLQRRLEYRQLSLSDHWR